ncbi:MAG: SDR family NAD(P)-dependent oxidoreductase [Firmicutes bacterium]|nr:SDR family NAD(P)-dependent oxidoreductase [Bacillota bacterium]
MKVAMTGITGGIGQAFAHALRMAGHDVFGLGRTPGPLVNMTLDVTWSSELIDRIVAGVAENWGPFDVWVNLAGADILSDPLRSAPFEKRLEELWQVDVNGTVKCCRAIQPYLPQEGKIINVAWDRALLGLKGEAGQLYALAKSAIIGYSKSLAQTLAPQAAVQVLAPGWVMTRWAQGLSSERRQRIIRHGWTLQWQTAEEIAQVLLWMAEAPQKATNGLVVYANAGHVAPS